jgi:SSS family solute:Na+ symporter
MGLSLTLLDWIVCLSTLGGSILLGLYLSARIKASENSANFFLAGRRLAWPVVGASLFSTNISSEHLVGLSGDAYRYGLSAGTVELATAICLGFTCAVMLPYYLKNKIYTIPEFLALRYNETARTFFSGLMLVICVMTKMGFTLFAGAYVLQNLLGWDLISTAIALAIICGIVTAIGGFAAVAFTDTIQTTIIIVGCGIMLAIGLDKVGGFSGLHAALDSAGKSDWAHIHKPYTDPNYPFWGIIAGALYGGVFYWGIDQVNVQRMLGAPNLHQARWGAMFAVLLKLTPVFIFAMPGVIARALYPDQVDPRGTFVLLLNNLLPSGIRGLVLSALLAALISSLLSIMNSISTLVVRDFVLKFKPDTKERAQVFLARIAVGAATVMGLGAAYMVFRTQDGLYKYLQTISIYLVMPITPAIVFGILSKKVTLKGAFASIVVGVLIATVYVVDQFMGPEMGKKILPFLHHTLTLNYTYRGLWGTGIVTAVLFLVSAFTPKTAPEKLATTTIDWEGRIEPFSGLSDWRLHFVILSLMTIGLYWWIW